MDIVGMENNVTMSTGLVTVGVRLGTIVQDVKEVNTIVQCKPINLSNYLKKKNVPQLFRTKD